MFLLAWISQASQEVETRNSEPIACAVHGAWQLVGLEGFDKTSGMSLGRRRVITD